ncbi:hypothetical protein CBER1_11447 [Cercospora berteroae]|uniref:Methyltransferase domain-containing protein n=1 Tax=Cercospora berteroae TaxID=357750 RepID=A0A2S6BZU4_9PEZI|nr:hypothetical protein CBER1_11447 [Cercospora berteroae]
MAAATEQNAVKMSATQRSFHQDSEAPYMLPNDAAEHARLERQSRMLSAIMNGKIPHAPLDPNKTQKLLDIGCGTGYVTKTLADKFPNAQVYGVDLTPVPQIRQYPPNVKFLQGNIVTQSPTEWKSLEGDAKLNEHENVFDLCFERLCVNSIPDAPGIIEREFQLLKPGGWIEMHELARPFVFSDGSSVSGIDVMVEMEKIYQEKSGAVLRPGELIPGWMRDAGFINVQTSEYRWPIDMSGASPAIRAEMSDIADGVGAKDQLDVMTSIIKRMHMRGLLNDEEASRMIESAKVFYATDVHLKYMTFTVTIGQKPE